MAKQTCMGASLKCSEGLSPCSLIVTSNMSVKSEGNFAATVNDFSIANIPSFGLCKSTANPTVAAAQGAPQPCIPVITGPWGSGSKSIKIMGQTALNDSSTCKCAFAGTIKIDSAGQGSVKIP